MTRNHDTHSKWLGRIKPASQTKHYHLERFMIMKQTTTSRLRRSDENVMHTQNVLRILRTQKKRTPSPHFSTQRSDDLCQSEQEQKRKNMQIYERERREERWEGRTYTHHLNATKSSREPTATGTPTLSTHAHIQSYVSRIANRIRSL